MNVREAAERLIALSEKEGATQAEAFAILAKTKSIYIDDNIPKIADSKVELGVGLKFIIGKKIGYTSSTLVSESPNEVVLRAKAMASISNEDSKFDSLPDPKKPSGSPDRFYNPKTAEVDSAYLLDKAMQVVDSAVSENVSVPNGVLRSSSIDFHVQNSLGVNAGSMSTMVFGHFTAKSEGSGVVGEGVQRCWSRSIHDIDFIQIGQKLKSQALAVLRAEPFKDKWEKIVAVLAPSEGSEMLGSLIGFAASAEQVNNKSSPWTDKVGDRVAHENLTVVDNGLSEMGLLSAVVDDEGTPTQTTLIIEKGVLKSYFCNNYNARQMDLPSTGNGIRRNPRDAQGGFISGAACRPTTLEARARSKSVDDIISGIDKGVYIEHFAYPLVDPMAGTFSNEVRNACLIENGELTTQVKYGLLTGNLYKSLMKEITLGADLQANSRYVMPTIAFSDVDLVGQ